MGSRSIAVIASVVVVILVVAAAVWTSSYNTGLVREWSSLQQKLAELDTRISSTNCDFADIDKSTKQLKSDVDEVKVATTVKVVPPFSGRKRLYFIDYLEKTSATLAAVSLNCSVWSASEISKLDQASEAMRNAQTTCALALGYPASRFDAFVSTSSTFNKMRQARKKVSLPKEDTGSSGGAGFIMPADPFIAGTWVGGGFEPWTSQRYGLKAVFGQNNSGSIRGYFYWSDSSGGSAKEELVGSIDSSGTILVRGIGLENVVNPPGHTYSTDTYRAVLSSDRMTIDGNWDKSNMRIGSHFTLRLQNR